MSREHLMDMLASLGTVLPDTMVGSLCAVCVEFLDLDGAGVLLMTEETQRGSLGASSQAAAELDRLQYTLGEGPSVDAWRSGAPVIEPNLANPRLTRWIAFSGPALAAGVRAMYAFPLRIGAVRLGALTTYRERPGDLSDEQYADAPVLADVVTQTVLGLQAQVPVGALAVEFDAIENYNAVVHQATGVVSAQLGISLTEALVSLRATAYARDRKLTDVARDIVARRLRLER